MDYEECTLCVILRQFSIVLGVHVWAELTFYVFDSMLLVVCFADQDTRIIVAHTICTFSRGSSAAVYTYCMCSKPSATLRAHVLVFNFHFRAQAFRVCSGLFSAIG